MHSVPRLSSSPTLDVSCINERRLDFLWLELTNRCNLKCVHCYTESDPHSGDRDLLTKDDYRSIMVQARALGCSMMQFIGGEPQVNHDFDELLQEAKLLGFEFIEVFTNLTRLSDKTLRFAADNNICFATSVYSDQPEEHDAITKMRSSHTRTITNLKKLIDAGIETRAAVIMINQRQGVLGRTRGFLNQLGVKQVSTGKTREFGRGEELLAQEARLSGLCGHCWNGKLCVAPDGVAYPCIMARQWPVGNVLEHSLAEIVRDRPLFDIRHTIRDTVYLPRVEATRLQDKAKRAAAEAQCTPENPTCGPDTGAPDCAPELQPQREGEDNPEPACFPCPQSCSPDSEVPPCDPSPCPKSCTPFPTGTPPAVEKDDPGKEYTDKDGTEVSDPACFPCPQSCSPDFEEPPCDPSPCPKSCTPFPTVKEQDPGKEKGP